MTTRQRGCTTQRNMSERRLSGGDEILLDGRPPNTLAFLERVEISTPMEGEPTLLLVGLTQARSGHRWPDPNQPFERLRISFSGVLNLRISQLGRTPQQILGFSIATIAGRGWENLRFEVSDYEEDMLFFWCKSYEVLDAVACSELPSWHDTEP